MARMTISLPDGLKRRMDDLDENVNWSRVAAEAFKNELAECPRRRKQKELLDTIERLRTTQLQQETSLYHSGHRTGTEWAKRLADYGQLSQLSEFMTRPDVGVLFDARTSDGFSPGEHLAFIIQGRDGHSVSNEFWMNMDTDGQHHDPEFARGFAAGALCVFNEVKSAFY